MWPVPTADNATFMCCLEIWEPQPPGTLTACPALCRGPHLYLYSYITKWQTGTEFPTCVTVLPLFSGLHLVRNKIL